VPDVRKGRKLPFTSPTPAQIQVHRQPPTKLLGRAAWWRRLSV